MGRHVLIIEDEMLIAFALEDELRTLGFTSFDVAQSTAEALACAQRHRPDAEYRIIGAPASRPYGRSTTPWASCRPSSSPPTRT